MIRSQPLRPATPCAAASSEAWALRVARWVGDDLPADEAAALERHLDACPTCRELADDLHDDRDALARLAFDQTHSDQTGDVVSLAAAVEATIAAAAADERAPERSGSSTRWPRALAAVLALALLGALAWVLVQRLVDPGATPTERLAETETTGTETTTEPPEQVPGTSSGQVPGTSKQVPGTVAEHVPGTSEQVPGTSSGHVPGTSEQVPGTPPEQVPGTSSGHVPGTSGEPVRIADAGAPTTTSGRPATVVKLVAPDDSIVFYWLLEPTD